MHVNKLQKREIKISFGDEEYPISKNLMECSSLINSIFRRNSKSSSFPMYEVDYEVYEILSEFLEINTNFKKYCFEDFIYVNTDFVKSQNEKFLSNFETETLLKVMHALIDYEIFVLTETIAFIISKRRVKFSFNKRIFVKYLTKEIPVSTDVAIAIIKYYDKKTILHLDKQILKCFKYNPTFDRNYDSKFKVDYIYLNDSSEMLDGDDYVILKKGYLEDKKRKGVVSVLNLILTPEDIPIEKTKVNIHDCFKTICENCFSGRNISSIVLNEGLKTIERHAFNGCRFTKLFLPESVETVVDFDDTLIHEIDLSHLKNMPTFKNCPNLSSIIFPSKIKTLPESCFKNCYFKSMNLPNSLTSLGKACFENCFKLEDIVLPEKLTTLPENCFLNCSMLINVDLTRITKFEKCCFKGCSNLKEIVITNATIEESAFEGCSDLKTVSLCNVVLNENCFRNCVELVSITLHDTETIPTGCFANCKKLTSVKLSDGLRIIMKNAFLNCTDLENLNIADENIGISKKAFKGCKKLKTKKFKKYLVEA